ncbi:Zinc-binding dehydrogenase [Burkholderia sp. D7]|nr:Zinc-binding dehydrogenase [Burkholderia sp. D7]
MDEQRALASMPSLPPPRFVDPVAGLRGSCHDRLERDCHGTRPPGIDGHAAGHWRRQYVRAAVRQGRGGRVIISSSSDEKLERARSLGADVTINYRSTPAWDEAVLAATDGAGADLIVETVGPSTFARSLNAAAVAATIFVVGFVSGMELVISILPINLKTLNIVGNNTGSTANLADAVRAIATTGIKPVIDRTFGFEQTVDAYRFVESAAHFGKVAIDLDA